VRSLTTNREAAAVSQPLIAADLDLALDVLGDVTTKIALDLVVGIDELANTQNFGVTQVANLRVVVDVECLEYVKCPRATDPEDIRETNLYTFVPWKIYSGDSSHTFLPLTLLVARVLTNHPYAAVPANDPTVLTHLLR
jgi:hypothetical protein